jgi:small subunit ribosomal protein S18
MAKVAPKRGKNKDNARRSKKKISVLNSERIGYVDYKDVNLLRRFMSDRAKIRARRVTGNDAQQQAAIALAVKNAREMALLPYSNRITQQRSNRDRGDRAGRADGPPPRPTAPPPGTDALGGDELDTDEEIFETTSFDENTVVGGDD